MGFDFGIHISSLPVTARPDTASGPRPLGSRPTILATLSINRTSVEYDRDRAICCVRVVGTITTRDDVRGFFGSAPMLLERKRCTRVLFGLRDAEIAESTVETFYTAADPEAWGWKRNYTAAVVYSEITEDERFLETVGANRGITIQIFDDMNEAKSWLSEV